MDSASSITSIAMEPTSDYYAARLQIIEAYESLAFAITSPSTRDAARHAPHPSVFGPRSRTHARLRFGPLVSALPLYHPLRIIEDLHARSV